SMKRNATSPSKRCARIAATVSCRCSASSRTGVSTLTSTVPFGELSGDIVIGSTDGGTAPIVAGTLEGEGKRYSRPAREPSPEAAVTIAVEAPAEDSIAVRAQLRDSLPVSAPAPLDDHPAGRAAGRPSPDQDAAVRPERDE